MQIYIKKNIVKNQNNKIAKIFIYRSTGKYINVKLIMYIIISLKMY
jgi:hypothetical protein